MFGELTLVDALLLTAMWLLIGAVMYGQLTIKEWSAAMKTPSITTLPADVRAAADGWVAAKAREDGMENHPLYAGFMAEMWVEAPVVLEWAAANVTIAPASNAWLAILGWPLLLLQMLARLIAKGVHLVILPEIRARAVAEMRQALDARAKQEAEARINRPDFAKFDAINELLNRDRGDNDDFGPAAVLF